MRAMVYRGPYKIRIEEMLLIVGDRVDAWESHLRALAAGRPDTRHQLLDPVVVAGPWVAAAGATVRGGRAVRRALRR